MFISLVIGVLAGLAVPFVTGPLADLTKSRFELNERDTGIASFGVVLLIASLIGAIIWSGFSAFWLVLGGLLGAFGMRLVALAQAQTQQVVAARKSLAEDAADAADDAADAAEDVVEGAKDMAKDAADTVAEKVDEVVKK